MLARPGTKKSSGTTQKKGKNNMEVSNSCVFMCEYRHKHYFLVCLLLAVGALDGSLVSTVYEKCERCMYLYVFNRGHVTDCM